MSGGRLLLGGVRLEWVVLCVLFLPPLCELSPYLPSYDIWEDGAKVKEFRKKFNENHTDSRAKHAYHPKNNTRKGKILSFFTVTDEDECEALDGRRSGLCLNPYSCRRRGGTSSGPCAHGFGVCCVFTVTCGKEVKSNITYFLSPQFPSLSRSMDSCSLHVHIMQGISQLRLDFIHFNLGQPNRLTGDCDSDLFTMSGGNTKDFKLCGQNSGQHIYYDIDKSVEMVGIKLRLSRPMLQRLWEIKVTQVPFAQRAPAGCLQYFTTDTGIIQTLNFAENGRHLADQDYRACVRQARHMCSIAYEPCDDSSFRIGPTAALAPQTGMAFGGGPGSFGGAGTEFIAGPMDNLVSEISPVEGDPGDTSEIGGDAVGSGDGAIPVIIANEIGRRFTRWSPYAQHLGVSGGGLGDLWRYWGYGNYGQGVSSFGRQRCQDRIITPCDGDEFLGANTFSPGVCDPYHCGTSLCTGAGTGELCRLETSAIPFGVGIRFGPAVVKLSPEDNIGACLRFEQVACQT